MFGGGGGGTFLFDVDLLDSLFLFEFESFLLSWKTAKGCQGRLAEVVMAMSLSSLTRVFFKPFMMDTTTKDALQASNAKVTDN